MKINSFNKLFFGCACALVSGVIYSSVDTYSNSEANFKSMEYIKTSEPQNAPKTYSENKCYLALHLDMVGVPFVQESGTSNKVENPTCGAKSSQKNIES